jgi:hypothetical protein
MPALKITILVEVEPNGLTLDQVSQIARVRVQEAIGGHTLFGLTGATAKHISVSVTQLKEVGKESACTQKKP